MNRYTKKEYGDIYVIVEDYPYLYGDDGLVKPLNKLCELEDIEELCEKIVEKPIYMKYRDTGEVVEKDYTDSTASYRFDLKSIELHYAETGDFNMCFDLKDYGKTWALTKEELE